MARRRPRDGSGVIYCITNLVNGKRYIGQTGLSMRVRWLMHKNEARRGSKYPLHLSMRKHGFENFCIESVIAISPAVFQRDPQLLDKLEIFFIKEFQTWTRWKNGYNATLGGKSTGSAENSPNYGRKHSEEFCRKASERMLGERNPNFGKHLPHHVREMTSLRFRGTRLSDGHRAKISEAHMSENPTPKALMKRRWRQRTRAMRGKKILRCDCPHRFPNWVIGRDFIECDRCGKRINMTVDFDEHEKLSWKEHER